MLRQGVQGITDLITIPGLINLDFADVRTIMQDAGSALMGIGTASRREPRRRGGQERDLHAAARGVRRGRHRHPAEHHRRHATSACSRSTRPPRSSQSAADSNSNIIFGAVIDEAHGRRGARDRDRHRLRPRPCPAAVRARRGRARGRATATRGSTTASARRSRSRTTRSTFRRSCATGTERRLNDDGSERLRARARFAVRLRPGLRRWSPPISKPAISCRSRCRRAAGSRRPARRAGGRGRRPRRRCRRWSSRWRPARG